MRHWSIWPGLCLIIAAAACGGESSGDGDPDGRGPIDKGDLLGSCAGDGADHCGGPSDGNCFCDPGCAAIGDCCDYAAPLRFLGAARLTRRLRRRPQLATGPAGPPGRRCDE